MKPKGHASGRAAVAWGDREKGKHLHPLLETQRGSSRKANVLSLRNADRDCHEALRRPHEITKPPRLEFT